MNRRLRRMWPYITLFCLLLTSCNRQTDSFVIQGHIYGSGVDSIIVTGLDNRFTRIDTIKYEDGTFTYSMQPDTMTPLILSFSDGTQEVVFAEKGMNCTLSKESPDSFCYIKGTPLNESLTSIRMVLEQDTCSENITNHIDSVISANPFAQFSPWLIYEYLIKRNNADRVKTLELIRKMSGTAQDNSLIFDLRNEMENRKIPVYLSVNSLRDTLHTKIDLAAMNAKDDILVCLWASWDTKSRNTRMSLDKLFGKYNNLTIADISIDTDTYRWKQAVLKDNIQHVQLIENEGWNSSIITALNIRQVPFFILISPQQRILEYSCSPEPIMLQLDSTHTNRKM